MHEEIEKNSELEAQAGNQLKKQFSVATSLPKYLAPILFLTLLFLVGWVSYDYIFEKMVEVESLIDTEEQIELKNNLNNHFGKTESETKIIAPGVIEKKDEFWMWGYGFSNEYPQRIDTSAILSGVAKAIKAGNHLYFLSNQGDVYQYMLHSPFQMKKIDDMNNVVDILPYSDNNLLILNKDGNVFVSTSNEYITSNISRALPVLDPESDISNFVFLTKNGKIEWYTGHYSITGLIINRKFTDLLQELMDSLPGANISKILSPYTEYLIVLENGDAYKLSAGGLRFEHQNCYDYSPADCLPGSYLVFTREPELIRAPGFDDTGDAQRNVILKVNGDVVSIGTLYGITEKQMISKNKSTTLLEDVQKISGLAHKLALKSDGTVWAWGQGETGQLGMGGRENIFQPTQIHGLEEVVDILADSNKSFAVKADGTVWAWGAGLTSKMMVYSGSEKAEFSKIPTQVFLHDEIECKKHFDLDELHARFQSAQESLIDRTTDFSCQKKEEYANEDWYISGVQKIIQQDIYHSMENYSGYSSGSGAPCIEALAYSHKTNYTENNILFVCKSPSTDVSLWFMSGGYFYAGDIFQFDFQSNKIVRASRSDDYRLTFEDYIKQSGGHILLSGAWGDAGHLASGVYQYDMLKNSFSLEGTCSYSSEEDGGDQRCESEIQKTTTNF